eukprot:SAG31_NODE_5603_length_2426_cov_4.864633_1_plen_52_part_00
MLGMKMWELLELAWGWRKGVFRLEDGEESGSCISMISYALGVLVFRLSFWF